MTLFVNPFSLPASTPPPEPPQSAALATNAPLPGIAVPYPLLFHSSPPRRNIQFLSLFTPDPPPDSRGPFRQLRLSPPGSLHRSDLLISRRNIRGVSSHTVASSYIASHTHSCIARVFYTFLNIFSSVRAWSRLVTGPPGLLETRSLTRGHWPLPSVTRHPGVGFAIPSDPPSDSHGPFHQLSMSPPANLLGHNLFFSLVACLAFPLGHSAARPWSRRSPPISPPNPMVSASRGCLPLGAVLPGPSFLPPWSLSPDEVVSS